MDAIAEAAREAISARNRWKEPGSPLGPGVGLAWFERRIPADGWSPAERRLLALTVFATLAAPASQAQAEEISRAAASISDPDLVLEAAGVVFTFNAINRIADARRVALELRWLRDLRPVRGWVERRFSRLTGLVYDLSDTHEARHSPDEMLGRLAGLSRERGSSDVPALFDRLRGHPAVLEGVTTFLEINARESKALRQLWIEAAAVAVGSRATSESCLRSTINTWLAGSEQGHCEALLARATSSESPADLNSACLRYAWQVANSAHTITEDDIHQLGRAGLSDPELLDLTIVASLFAALAAIEPLTARIGLEQFNSETR